MISVDSLSLLLATLAERLPSTSSESATTAASLGMLVRQPPENLVGETCAAAQLQFLSRHYDMSHTLYKVYDEQGKRLCEQTISEQEYQIFAGLLFLRVLVGAREQRAVSEQIKYINVCWKAFDRIRLPDGICDASADLVRIQAQLLTTADAFHPASAVRNRPLSDQADGTGFTTLPIDVLFYEGPIARAYLEILHSLGFRPRRIIQLISTRNLVTGKPVGRFLPDRLRKKYAAAVQTRQIHHWPTTIYRRHRALCHSLFDQLAQRFEIAPESLQAGIDLKPLQSYADTVTPFLCGSLNDPALIEFLQAQGKARYLFTGGGIIPAPFFALEGVSFIHIHPGYLPDIRGADCLLWSLLLTGRPSASCFFMNAGIDTGDILNAAYLPCLQLPAEAKTLNSKMLYRLLYSFVDPWVRAFVLRDTVLATEGLAKLTATPQSAEQGTTFHFMHSTLQAEVIQRYLLPADPLDISARQSAGPVVG